MVLFGVNPVNLEPATEALIFLLANASFNNQRHEMLGDASVTLTRVVRVFDCLIRPRINTTASPHPRARTRYVSGTSFVDRLASGLCTLSQSIQQSQNVEEIIKKTMIGEIGPSRTQHRVPLGSIQDIAEVLLGAALLSG